MRIRNPLPKKNRELVLNRDGRRCAYCGKGDGLEVDHVVPIKHNGTDLMSNLITSCKKCNGSKSRHRLLPVFERQVLEWVRVANETNGIDGNMDAAERNGEINYLSKRIYTRYTDEEKKAYESNRPTGKQKKRTLAIENRIPLDSPLYYYSIYDVDELRRARRACGVSGCEFMAIATGNGSQKLFFTTRRIRHAVPIEPIEARELVSRCSKKMLRNKISGTLGVS